MRWIRRRVVWIAAACAAGFLVWIVATAASLQVSRVQSMGSLFGRPVTADTFQKAFEAVMHDAVLRYGDQARRTFTDQMLAEQVWERLMLLEEARSKKIRVSDREVVEELRSLPLFLKSDGAFDMQGYQNLIRYSLGTNPRKFEEEMRENMTIRKLIQQAIPTPAVSDEEIAEAFRKKQTSIRITALKVPDPGLAQEALHAVRQMPQQIETIARQLGETPVATSLFKREDQIKELDLAGRTVSPLFEKEPGEADGPFRHSAGWLIARLEEKKVDSETQPTDKDRESLREELASQKQMTAYMAWYKDLVKRANVKKKPLLGNGTRLPVDPGVR